jgi:hypothetical protein
MPLAEPFVDLDLALADFLVLAGFDLVDRERLEEPVRADAEPFFV